MIGTPGTPEIGSGTAGNEARCPRLTICHNLQKPFWDTWDSSNFYPLRTRARSRTRTPACKKVRSLSAVPAVPLRVALQYQSVTPETAGVPPGVPAPGQLSRLPKHSRCQTHNRIAANCPRRGLEVRHAIRPCHRLPLGPVHPHAGAGATCRHLGSSVAASHRCVDQRVGKLARAPPCTLG